MLKELFPVDSDNSKTGIYVICCFAIVFGFGCLFLLAAAVAEGLGKTVFGTIGVALISSAITGIAYGFVLHRRFLIELRSVLKSTLREEEVNIKHLRNSGLRAIFPSFPMTIVEEQIKSARKAVRILTPYLVDANGLQEQVCSAVANGATVQVIILAPFSEHSELRQRDLGMPDGHFLNNITASIAELMKIGERLTEMGFSSQSFEFRISPAATPTMLIYSVDDQWMSSPLALDSRGVDGVCYEFAGKNAFGTKFIKSHFEKTWDQGDPIHAYEEAIAAPPARHSLLHSSGLTGYFHTASDIRLIDRIESAKHRVQWVHTWTGLGNSLRNALHLAAENGVDIELLFLHPLSPQAEYRSSDLDQHPQYAQTSILGELAALEELVGHPRVTIRLFDATPTFPLYIIDDKTFYGGLWRGSGEAFSANTPFLESQMDCKIGRLFQIYFSDLWDNCSVLFENQNTLPPLPAPRRRRDKSNSTTCSGRWYGLHFTKCDSSGALVESRHSYELQIDDDGSVKGTFVDTALDPPVRFSVTGKLSSGGLALISEGTFRPGFFAAEFYPALDVDRPNIGVLASHDYNNNPFATVVILSRESSPRKQDLQRAFREQELFYEPNGEAR